jgi:hypothetical protein
MTYDGGHFLNRYAHLNRTKGALFMAAEAKLGPHDEAALKKIRKAIRAADWVHEVEDVAELLTLERSADDDGGEKLLPNGCRRPVRKSLYTAARKAQAQALTDKLGLSVEDLVANYLEGQENRPLDEMLRPEEAAQDFIDECGAELSAELKTAEGALSAARELFAQKLAAHADVRMVARQEFAREARIRVMPTKKGKQEIDHLHPLYRVVADLMTPMGTPLTGQESVKMGGLDSQAEGDKATGAGRGVVANALRPGPPPFRDIRREIRWRSAETRRQALADGEGAHDTDSLVRNAELLLLLFRAEEEGYVTYKLEMPDEAEAEPERPSLVEQVRQMFVTTT